MSRSGFTHVSLEIVVLHSVICHVVYPPIVRWLMARPESNDLVSPAS